jgi:large subunit ribosomal protein L23
MKSPITPHITEKSYRSIDKDGQVGSSYTFKVATSLNKDQVKSLVERDYKVTVVDVNIVRLPGKVRRFKGVVGHTSVTKKAIVRLKKGDRIAAFDIDESKSADKE